MTHPPKPPAHSGDRSTPGRLFGVLVTCARPGQLAISLERLSRSSVWPELLIVVDNRPTDGNERLVATWNSRDLPVRYVASPENLGPAGARNLGAAQLTGAGPEDWVVFFDDDEHLPTPETLGSLLSFARATRLEGEDLGGVALAGARIDWRRARTESVEASPSSVAVHSLHGWAFPMYRVGPFRETGGFDAALFFGLEELELGLRLVDAGHRLVVHADLAFDLGVRSEGHVSRPRFALEEPRWQRYYSLRNLLVLLRRQGRPGLAARVALTRGFAKPLANLPVRPRSALRHLRLNGRAVKDGLLMRLGRRLEPDTDPSRWDRPGRAAKRFSMPNPDPLPEDPFDRATPKELIERFLSGVIDQAILVRRLTELGISSRGAVDHARILAPRVTRPTPRWGVGQWVDGGDLYAETDSPDPGKLVAVDRSQG